MDARFPDGSRELLEGVELPEALAAAEEALERGADEVTLYNVERRKTLEDRMAAIEAKINQLKARAAPTEGDET